MKQTLGERVAQLRREKGMTQLELAEQMGITDKAVSKWERNLSCPDIQSVPLLAQILGVTVEELLQGGEKTAATEKNGRKMVNLCLKAVILAMGVSVSVLSVVGKLDVMTGIRMLGIGMTCGGILLLQEPQ